MKRGIHMKTVERLVLKYIVCIVYVICSLVPVKKRVVFATYRTTKLSDNFKFIYNEMKSQPLDYEYVFLLKKMESGVLGKIKYLLHLLKATYYLATSAFFIIDDFYFPVYVIKPRKGTEVIQVWHACGAFKKFGYSILDKEDGGNNDYIKYVPIHKNYAHVLVSSQEVSKHYAEAFNMSEENIRPIGIPRIDLFFNEELKQEAITRVYKAYPMLEGKKLVLYAPTFRGANQAQMHMNIPFDLNQVVTCLDENTILGLKMHPFIKDLPDLTGYDNIVDLSLYPEINDILLITDQLITDYSSIVFEYSLLERPMIFYAHDRNTYIKERDFYYEYESLVPGPIVENTIDLIDALKNSQFNKEEVIEFKQKFFDEPDGQATKRFINQIILKH